MSLASNAPGGRLPAVVLVVGLSTAWLWADQSPTREWQQTQLGQLKTYVGGWRGVGQVRRGSRQGAWREDQQWSWDFQGEIVTLQFRCEGAKFATSGSLRAVAGDERFELVARFSPTADSSSAASRGEAPSDEVEVRYRGSLDGSDRLVLQSTGDRPLPPGGNIPTRITLHQVANGDRMLVLYERQLREGAFARMAEVGLTREGSRFGQGSNYIECVVTGGLGTIPVTYQGQTYYVCCTGCRDYSCN